MAEVRIMAFGGMVVERHGRPATALLAQRKMLALLALLSAHMPMGLSRERVIAFLWPDADEEHGRNALGQLLHRVRRDLGADAIATDGNLRLNDSAVSSDVADFRGAIAHGDLAGAAALYRGDFLLNFSLRDAVELEHWIDAERMQLRSACMRALQALSAGATAHGDRAGAAEWLRRCVELDPLSSRVAIQYMDALAAIGDCERAIRHAEIHAAVVRAELEIEPDMEVQRRADALRAMRNSALTNGLSPKPSRAEAPVLGARSRLSGWMLITLRSWRGWIGSFALAMTLLAVLTLVRANRSSTALDPLVVSVAPFKTLFGPDSEWREGLAQYFADALDGAGPLRSVPVRAALRSWDGRGDHQSAVSLARSQRAGLALHGVITRIGSDSIRLGATLLDASSESVVADREMTGARDHLIPLADSVVLGLLLDLSTSRHIGIMRPSGSIRSRSPAAVRAFLRGDQAYRRAVWDSAQRYYEQAVALDTTFALAIRQLGRLEAWRRSIIGVGMPAADAGLLISALRASRFAHGVSARDSLLLLADSLAGALTPGLCGDSLGRHQLLAVTDRLTTLYPTDAESWVARGDALYECGGYFTVHEPTIGRRTMLQAYDSAIALDRDFAQAYDRTFRLALDLGDTERVLRNAAYYLTLHPAETNAAYLRLLTGLLRRPQDARQILDTTSAEHAFQAYTSLLLIPDSAELAVAAGRRLADTTSRGGAWKVYPALLRMTDATPFRHRPLALALAYRGHLHAAAQLVGTERSEFGAELAPHLALLGAIPRRSADSAFRRWLQRPFVPGRDVRTAMSWWGAQHDTLALQEYHRVALPSGTPLPATPSLHVGAVRFVVVEGYISLARGDTDTAIRLLSGLTMGGTGGWIYEPIVAARLLASRSQLREAFALLDRDMPLGTPTALDGLWAIEHARLARRLGERDKARRSYDYVRRLWRNADPELQGFVREATEALARL